MRSSWLMFLYYIIINRKDSAYAIPCYDCRADDGSCNVGECKGMVCVKMETANMDNGKLGSHKWAQPQVCWITTERLNIKSVN
uniref:Secreted protein n=1 Tax=Acrobeloides nanus TaxID=290746 RepID=A0A914CZI9_9BILA